MLLPIETLQKFSSNLEEFDPHEEENKLIVSLYIDFFGCLDSILFRSNERSTDEAEGFSIFKNIFLYF